MTITNDDPEIVLGGGSDPTPTAPLLTDDGSTDLPTAVATPVMASQPTATAPPLASAARTSTGGEIERTSNEDGSLSVKITTTRPQPNGYREVTTEHFHIPSGVVGSVELSLDNGDPPSSLYMTRMEQQVLPPTTGAVMSRPPAYPTPGVSTAQPDEPSAPSNQEEDNVADQNRVKGQRGIGVVIGIIAVVIISVVVASNGSSPSPTPAPYPSWDYPPSPSWHYPSPSYPWSPSYPTTGSNYPTVSHAPSYWWQKPAGNWPIPTWPTPDPTNGGSSATSPVPTTKEERKSNQKEERSNRKESRNKEQSAVPSNTPIVTPQVAPSSSLASKSNEIAGRNSDGDVSTTEGKSEGKADVDEVSSGEEGVGNIIKIN